MAGLTCGSCGAVGAGTDRLAMRACGSPLELELPPADPATFADDEASGVWRYRGWLPPVEPVALGEPTTALVEVRGEGTVLAKLEGGLPTGSFKDRGTAVTVSWLRAHGVREIVVDSSGNAGASFAAYAARAGMRLRLFVPADASPAKLLQARAHGAVVVSVPGPRSAAGEAARRALDDAGRRRRLRLAPVAAGIPRRAPRPSPTRSSSSWAAGRPTSSSRRSVVARCCSASTSASTSSGRRA